MKHEQNSMTEQFLLQLLRHVQCISDNQLNGGLVHLQLQLIRILRSFLVLAVLKAVCDVSESTFPANNSQHTQT